MRAQDIHISDADLWKQFLTLWGQGNYLSAIQILTDNPQLQTKYMGSPIINFLHDELSTLHTNQDLSFKADKIQVATQAPVLSAGEVYFQIQ